MEKYYAINSYSGYVMGIEVNGSLQVAGSLVKTMTNDEVYIKHLYDVINKYTEHIVSLEEITLNVEEVE